MFHQRIASNLRNQLHSPLTSPSSPTSETPAASPRLVLLSAPSGVPAEAPIRHHLLAEFIRVSSHRVAAFLAEAAVLVLVLGILDRFLASNRFELHWVGGAFLISGLLLAGSIALELSARRWLARV